MKNNDHPVTNDNMPPARAIVLMGVSGSGKTSLGHALAEVTGLPFYDGDKYHPQENIEKMAKGIPLDDQDRQPWLEQLHQLMIEHLTRGQSLIVASSALKTAHRRILDGGREDIRFVYLEGSFDLILSRMQQRSDHFMKAEMLQSQFAALEEPIHALTVSINASVERIVEQILADLAA